MLNCGLDQELMMVLIQDTMKDTLTEHMKKHMKACTQDTMKAFM